MSPLCITISDKSMEELEFDEETGTVVCVEGTETDALALSVVELQN